MLSRAAAKQGWVRKQGLNYVKSRIRDAWKRWVLKQGLHYVKTPIREADAQAHAESPPRPKTYSWTATFRAPCVVRRRQMRGPRFDLRTRRNREPAMRYTWTSLRAQKTSCDKKLLRSHAASTWICLHAHRDMFLLKDCCDLTPPDRLMHTIMLRFGHGGTVGSQSAHKKTWISIHEQGNRFMRQKNAAFSRCGHTWISLCAQ